LCAIDHFIVVVMIGSMAHNALGQSCAVVIKSRSFNGLPIRGAEMVSAGTCTKTSGLDWARRTAMRVVAATLPP